MNDEIKEILSKMERLIVYGKYNAYYDLEKQLLDYITNLQTIEQQYSAVLSENAELTNLCNKYEEEHNTTFQKWQKVIKKNENYVTTDEITYQMLVDKIENLQTRIDKAIEYSKGNINALENRLSTPFCNFEKATKELSVHQEYLNILQGSEDNA